MALLLIQQNFIPRLEKLGNEIGISIDRVFNEQLKGVSREDSLQLLLKYGKRRHVFF